MMKRNKVIVPAARDIVDGEGDFERVSAVGRQYDNCEKVDSRLWLDNVTDVAKYHHDSTTAISQMRESCIKVMEISSHNRETTYFGCKGNYFFWIYKTYYKIFLILTE